MKMTFLTLTLACSVSAVHADDVARRIADDAKVIRRIADVSKRDFPESVVKRILEEDLELARGRNSDGSYDFAHYEREEASRTDDRFAVRSENAKRLDTGVLSGENVYRVIVSVPNRRLLVARNRRVYIDHVEIESTPFGGAKSSTDVEVKSWLSVGEEKSVEIPNIARKAKVTVAARVDEKAGGPATVEIALLHPRLVDKPESPYAAAVRSIKSLQSAADRREIPKVKAFSTEMLEAAGGTRTATSPEPQRSHGRPVRVTGESTSPSEFEPVPQVEIYMELQAIEDLLTGAEGERRDGLDRLHQLVRRLRR